MKKTNWKNIDANFTPEAIKRGVAAASAKSSELIEQRRNESAFRKVIGGAALIGAAVGAALGVALS